MAFLYPSLYTDSILHMLRLEDQAFNRLLATYKQRGIPFRDFGVGLDVLPDLHPAIGTLGRLSSSATVSDLPLDAAEVLSEVLPAPYWDVLSVWNAKTPLYSTGVIRQMLDKVVHAVESITPLTGHGHRHGVGTDELIPLLAYVIVQAQPLNLESLLFYVTHFRLSEALAPDLE
jgi:hypothetical protein